MTNVFSISELERAVAAGVRAALNNVLTPATISSTQMSDTLHLKVSVGQNSNKSDRINQRNLGDKFGGNKFVVKGHAPTPFSALLYQCLFNGSLTPADFLRLFRETITELNSSKQLTRMMVVWPKYLEKTKENRNTSQLPETFNHFPFSLNPVALQKEQPELGLLQNDGMVHYAYAPYIVTMEVYVSPSCASSGLMPSDSKEPACSFICSLSTTPAETRDEEHNLLSDNHMPSKAVTQCCSHIILTVGDVPKVMLIKSSSQESVHELVISENGVEDVLTGTIAGNPLDPAESHMVDAIQAEDSNKDKQTVPYNAAVIPVYGDHFLIPEKMIDDMAHIINRAEDESEQFSVLASESVYCQDAICDEVSGSSNFLDLKPLRRALPYPPVEKNLGFFCYDTLENMDQPEILTSCAIADTMQDLLEQFHEQNLTLKDGEPFQASSLVSVRSATLVMDFNPVRCGSHPHQLQRSLGAPLLALNPAEKNKDKTASEGRSAGIKEVACFRTTSDRMGDCKLGSWWKQALETRRASTGLLPAIEQIPAVTKEKRHSLVIGWPQSHGLIRECQNVKQATMEEPSSRKAKGKRSKWVK